MREIFCWRCDKIVPMLEEEEYTAVKQLYRDCSQSVVEYRKGHHVTLGETEVEEFYQPFYDRYKELTGLETVDFELEEIWNHRLALFGPPCVSCGKPLRSPKARVCYECGVEVEKTITPTDPEYEKGKGRVPVWLDPDDVRFLIREWKKVPVTESEENRETWFRIAFRLLASLHKSGHEQFPEE